MPAEGKPFDLADVEDPMHYWFGLGYSSYLVLPRSLIQSMPAEWQLRMVRMLQEMENRFGSPCPGYKVTAVDRDGREIEDDLADYERGRRRIPPKD